jgi:integrase
MKPERKTERARRGRGEGSVYQRKDGTWCASVSAGYSTAGKRRRRIPYADTKQEVMRKIRAVQQSGLIETSRLTVGQFLETWLTGTVENTVAPTTALRYGQVVRLHVSPHIGSLRLAAIQPIHVQQLYEAQAKAGASLRNQQMSGLVLQKALKAAVRLRLIQHNPCVDVDKPRPTREEMQVWDLAQATRFLKATEADRLHAMYVLALMTGTRQGELFGLEWPDVDWEGSAVTVRRTLEEISGRLRTKEPKTRAGTRRIDLPQVAVDALRAHQRAMLAEGHIAGPIFCDREGNHLRKSNVVRRSFKPAIDRANQEEGLAPIPSIRFHDLRHTAATLLLLQGVHPKVVSERLGHASVEITLNTYSHVLPTMQKEAAEKLNRLFG